MILKWSQKPPLRITAAKSRRVRRRCWAGSGKPGDRPGGLAGRPVLLGDFDHHRAVRWDFGGVLIGDFAEVGVLPDVAHFVRAFDANVAPFGGDLGGGIAPADGDASIPK